MGSPTGLLRDAETRQLRRTPADEARFRRALALRELLYEIFSRAAKGKKPEPEALQAFQSFYQNAVRHAEFHPVANHYRLTWPATTHPLEHVLHEITGSAAKLLTSEALTRVRQCSGETCSWLFVDTSRNGLRRWCDMKACGNRANSDAFAAEVMRANQRAGIGVDEPHLTRRNLFRSTRRMIGQRVGDLNPAALGPVTVQLLHCRRLFHNRVVKVQAINRHNRRVVRNGFAPRICRLQIRTKPLSVGSALLFRIANRLR